MNPEYNEQIAKHIKRESDLLNGLLAAIATIEVLKRAKEPSEVETDELMKKLRQMAGLEAV